MPAPTTFDDFLEICRKSGVVEEIHLLALSGPALANPISAAKALIRAGALTKFQAAQFLSGKYRGLMFDRLKILDRIGAGGMGTVFLCEHTGLQKQVAVKVLPPDQAQDEGTRERFFREARAAATLDHPNVVRVHDASSSGGVHYIVMEYVEGRDLQTILNKYGPLPYRRACTYIAQAALGLQHAHEKGLVHRDVKPGNLLVDKDGVVKVLDLGLARFCDGQDSLTAKYDRGAVLGTADFMAPEQVMASSTVDIRADIYSLGVTLYALINGKPPFGGSSTQKLVGHTSHKAVSLTTIRREVPKGLSAVVDRMIAKDPIDRYQTPADVVEALESWLDADADPVQTAIVRKGKAKGSGRHSRGRLRRPTKSKKPYVLSAIAVSVVVFGGLIAWALSGSSEPAQAVAGPNSPTPTPAVPNNSSRDPVALPVARPTPPSERVLYETDFSKQSLFRGRMTNPGGLTLTEGSLPQAWQAYVWRDGSTGELALEEFAGKKAVALWTTDGLASVEMSSNVGGLIAKPGRQYRLEIEYAAPGPLGGRADVRTDNFGRAGTQLLLPSSNTWSKRSVDFRVAEGLDRPVVVCLAAFGVSRDQAVYFRTVTVSEVGVTAQETLVYRLDFTNKPAQKRQFRNNVAEGPIGSGDDQFLPFAWDPTAVAEIAIEPVDGAPALTLRTVEGKPSAMIFGPTLSLQVGRTYKARVEYRLPGPDACILKIADNEDWGRQLADFPPTDAWTWAEVAFRPMTSTGIARLEFGSYGKSTLAIRSLEVFDLGVDGPANTVAYDWSAASAEPVKPRRTNTTPIEITRGITAGVWNPQSITELGIGGEGDSRALTIRPVDGPTSGYVNFAEFRTRPGTKYWVSIEYDYAARSGAMHIRVRPTGTDGRMIGQLVGTRGERRTTHSVYHARADEPAIARIELFDGDTQKDQPVRIRSVRVTEATDAVGRAEVAATVYRFAAADAKPFKASTGPGKLVASDKVPEMPANFWADSWNQGDTGEVAVETIAGRQALTLMNAPGTASIQLFNSTPVAELKAGAGYLVKIVYQTGPAGNGEIQARRNGDYKTKFGGLTLPSTANEWREASFPLTSNIASPVVIFVQNMASGPDGKLAIHSIEILPGEPAAGQLPTDYHLDLSETKPFARRFRKEAIVESQGDGDFPVPWSGRSPGEGTGDVFAELLGGTTVLGLRNHEGKAQTELFTRADLVRATVGKRYVVKVTYQTEANGHGQLLVKLGDTELGRKPLNSAATWTEAELTVSPPTARGLRIAIVSGSTGSEASVYIKSIEVRELP